MVSRGLQTHVKQNWHARQLSQLNREKAEDALSHCIIFVNFIQLIYSCRAHEAEIKVL